MPTGQRKYQITPGQRLALLLELGSRSSGISRVDALVVAGSARTLRRMLDQLEDLGFRVDADPSQGRAPWTVGPIHVLGTLDGEDHLQRLRAEFRAGEEGG